MGGENAVRRVTCEGCVSRDHLVGHHSQGIEIGGGAGVGVRSHLFGGHVCRGTDGHPRGGELRVPVPFAAGGHCAGHSKIHDQGVASREHDVLGFDVAMHDAEPVRRTQGIGDITQDSEGVLDGERPLPRESGAQRLSLDVGHGVEEEVARGARVEQGNDVGVLQLRGDADLLEKTVGPDDRCQVGVQYLEGHAPVVPQVMGQEHRGHSPAPDLLLHPVAVRQSGLEAGKLVRGRSHGRKNNPGGRVRGLPLRVGHLNAMKRLFRPAERMGPPTDSETGTGSRSLGGMSRRAGNLARTR